MTVETDLSMDIYIGTGLHPGMNICTGTCLDLGMGIYIGTWPRSEAIDIVIIVNLLFLARTLGLKQNACGVQSSMSGLLSAIVIFMT